jgi:hypothetical protein
MTSPIGGGPTTITNPGGIAGAPYATQLDADIAALWKRVPRRLDVTGTNALTATTPAGDLAISALVEGMRLCFTPVANNTGAMTIAVDGLPSINLVNSQGNALTAGQARSGEPCEAVIDATGKARIVVGIFASATPTKTTILANQRTGASGGGLTSGADQTIALNVELIDEIGVSGTLPDFIMPAGTYDIDIDAAIENVGGFQLRLYNVTDGADVAGVYGLAERVSSSNQTYAGRAQGRFTLASAKTLRLVARVSVTNASDGQGGAVDAGGWFATAALHNAIVKITEARSSTAGPTGSTGATGPAGADGTDPGVLMTWSTTTTDADPGAGFLQANNASLASATQIFISKTGRGGASLAAFLATLANSTNTAKGTLTLTNPATEAQALFNVTGITDATGYVKVAVASPSGATSFPAAAAISFQFARAGDRGAYAAQRVTSTASSATPTPNCDTTDQYQLTALAAGATFGAPTGTPANGQRLIIRITDNGTARTLAWNAIYRAIGSALPTTTVINKTVYVGLIYNSLAARWDCVAVAQEL